ncbi:hypothetical protein [Nocardia sp. NBC_01327]|uniref:hypothetical protein n=1 Tax=Nocardia sp. NBC_01327 TaxID=2903593 RepID=UPI002E154168|nr:hypothetical protein OG326_16025 [Nocardia sp. NBC_01327]
MRTSTNKSRRAAIITAIAVAAVGTAAGTAHADTAPVVSDPQRLSTQILPGVQYTSDLTDGSVLITTPIGTLTTRGGQFQAVDQAGNTVAGNGFLVPPAAAVQPQATVSVSPEAAAVAAPADADPGEKFNRALGQAGAQFGLATGIGSLVGGTTGVIVGCVAGAFTGGSLFIPVSLGTLSLPAALAGCVGGGAMLGGFGTAIGAAVLGIPVGIASAIQMYNTLNAPAAPGGPATP